MQIRKATQGDEKALLDYLSEFWADGCDTVIQRPSIPSLEREKEWLATKDGVSAVVFIAVKEGRVLGIIEGSIQNISEFSHNCEFGMAVLKNFRGKSIGRKLIQSILDWRNSATN